MQVKCHQIHIGKSDNMCPTLKAHDIDIEKVTEDTYVGDVVSNDGKVTKNIKFFNSGLKYIIIVQ